MKTEQLQLVTFEQAKRLRALGFDWQTEHFYLNGSLEKVWERTNHNHNFYKKSPKNEKFSAPTVALALKFLISKLKDKKFRKKIKIEINIKIKINIIKITETDLNELLDELLTLLEKNI